MLLKDLLPSRSVRMADGMKYVILTIYFTKSDATVMCRELGYSDIGVLK